MSVMGDIILDYLKGCKKSSGFATFSYGDIEQLLEDEGVGYIPHTDKTIKAEIEALFNAGEFESRRLHGNAPYVKFR